MNRTIFKNIMLQHEIVNGKHVEEVFVVANGNIISTGTPDTVPLNELDKGEYCLLYYSDDSWNLYGMVDPNFNELAHVTSGDGRGIQFMIATMFSPQSSESTP